MSAQRISEGWVVLKTLQAFAKQYPHIAELWISVDATRGMLDVLNLGKPSDRDVALAHRLKQDNLLPVRFVDKVFRGTNNFSFGQAGNRTTPDVLLVEEPQPMFKSIHVIECKGERSDRLWAQLLRVRSHVDYAWAALPYDIALLYDTEIRRQRWGLVTVSADEVAQPIQVFSEFRFLHYPGAQSDLKERAETVYRINEMHGLERVSWDSKFETAHILHTRINLTEMVQLLLRLITQTEYTEDEIRAYLCKAKGDFRRLKLLSEQDDRLVLSYGCLKIQLSLLRVASESGLVNIPNLLRQTPQKGISRQDASRLVASDNFERHVIPIIREHFLQTDDLQTLMNWIKALGGKATMIDLFEYAIDTERWAPLKWLLIGNTPSTAPATIRDGSEICLNCGKREICAQWVRKQPNAIDAVMSYREAKGRAMITRIRNDEETAFRELLADPLYIKFLVPYTLVQENKRLLIRLYILTRDSKVLQKSDGRYCPFDDVWELAPRILSS
jgi:hypothetical protein